jgi:hypothetical protein
MIMYLDRTISRRTRRRNRIATSGVLGDTQHRFRIMIPNIVKDRFVVLHKLV